MENKNTPSIEAQRVSMNKEILQKSTQEQLGLLIKEINEVNATFALRLGQIKHLVATQSILYTDSNRRTEVTDEQKRSYIEVVQTLVENPSLVNSDPEIAQKYGLLQNILIAHREDIPENLRLYIALPQEKTTPNKESNEEEKPKLAHPVEGAVRVTGVFGEVRGKRKDGKPRIHNGIDLAGIAGTPILAWKAGTVELRTDPDGYGTYILMKHDDGSTSLYGHLQEYVAGLQSGQYVEAGTRIGFMGTTGRSTGPHLHFETYRNGKSFDPVHVCNEEGHFHLAMNGKTVNNELRQE